MKFGKLVRQSSLLFVFALLMAVPTTHASTSDFTIDNFEADYTLGEDDPQGTLRIREQLTVEFNDYNHGILRALPQRYNGLPQHIDVRSVTRDGTKEKHSTYKSNGNVVLKIGNPNSTITGLHHYEIDYKVTNVIRFVGTQAELNWNVNGTGWQQTFLHVSARLHMPENLKNKITSPRCYTGINHSAQTDCLVTSTNDGMSYTTTRSLHAGESLTFNNVVPADYFRKPTPADRWDDYKGYIIPIVGFPLAAFAVMARVWYRNGRDAKGRGTVVPEYGPPDNLKPAEIDTLIDYKLGKNAISATIIDLAIRKHLRIQEGTSEGILGLGKHKIYSFIKLPPPANSTLADYEAVVLAGLFAKGDAVETGDLKNSFYKTLQSVQKSIPKSLTSRSYFASNPATAGGVWGAVGLVVIFGSFWTISLSVAVFIGLILAGLVIVLFAWLMPRRTPKGALAKDAAEGLKMYLNTAEKDRIAQLQSPNAPYAEQTAEPVKTVELFEKLLPYAMVLGVEKQWAGQFEHIYTTPPDWYSGNWSTFNALYLADSLSNSMSAMNSSFAAPSSGNSGFSGGSGGGGGGGGGGGW